jgi:hypothetical protein
VEFRILGSLGYWRTATRSSGIERGPCGPARRVSLALSRSSEPRGDQLHSPPVDPPPTWGNSVIGSGEIRPIVLMYGHFVEIHPLEPGGEDVWRLELHDTSGRTIRLSTS